MNPLLVRPGTSDVKVFAAVWVRECFEVPELPVDPKLILDLGAYTGLSTRWFCDRFPGAEVIAVEPNPQSITYLHGNAPHATVMECAIGDGAALPLSASERGEWAVHTRPSRDPIMRVPSKSIDEILAGREPDIVKMDIEGAERSAFRGPCEWLDRVGLLFLETHDRFAGGCLMSAQAAVDATGRDYRWRTRNGSSCDHIVRFR